MRASISLTTIFKAMFAFTLLFAAFVTLAIVYNKAYKLKNEVISILEKQEGISKNSIQIINNYLESSGYEAKANCADGEYGMRDLANTKLEKADSKTKYYYCVSEHCTMPSCAVSSNNNIYFNVKVFFKFDLPFFGDLMVFPINGETKAIRLYQESQRLEG